MLYKLTIKPVSSFVSQLQSDTLFGAFCWSYKYLYGEEELCTFLRECMNGKPSVIFSNVFPSGYLPVPIGVYKYKMVTEIEGDKQKRKAEYQKNKKYKKYDLILKEAFLRSQNGNWEPDYNVMGKNNLQEASVIHNMVRRDKGSVTNTDGAGNLYSICELYPPEDAKYDVYILSDMDIEVLKKVCSMMFLLGIGAKKSSGKGGFEILSWEEETELLEMENPNAYVAISNFIPNETDPINGYYKTLIKNGKLDREYAVTGVPFKKTLLYLCSGSTFYTDEVKKFYGKCINDIAINSEIVVNACTIAIPIRIE